MIYGKGKLSENIASDMNGRSHYTIEDKRRALSIFERTGSYGEVEKELGVSRNTVRAWKEKYGSAGALKDIKDLYNDTLPQNVSSKAIVRDRRNSLVRLVEKVVIGSSDLAELLGVTTVTVRDDIRHLLSVNRVINISLSKTCYLIKAA